MSDDLAGASPVQRPVMPLPCKVAKTLMMMLAWVLGCIAFDAVLQWRGPWLMLGGALTWMACNILGRAVDALAA